MARHHARYDRVAAIYSQVRPTYPPELIDHLANKISVLPSAAGLVADIGSGTGAFTRLLRAALPARLSLLGVEPGLAMRERAAAETPPDAAIAYRDGTAEALPLDDGAALAVVAATAAHWFDRPRFYREAHRALAPNGILAIAEYVRDTASSPLAAALVAFMAERGSQRAYTSGADYRAELAALPGFRGVDEFVLPRELRLSLDGFIGLALSSSHAAGLVERSGEEGARAALRDLALPYRTAEHEVPFGYLFQCITARRNP